jgi:hypothetical protein
MDSLKDTDRLVYYYLNGELVVAKKHAIRPIIIKQDHLEFRYVRAKVSKLTHFRRYFFTFLPSSLSPLASSISLYPFSNSGSGGGSFFLKNFLLLSPSASSLLRIPSDVP